MGPVITATSTIVRLVTIPVTTLTVSVKLSEHTLASKYVNDEQLSIAVTTSINDAEWKHAREYLNRRNTILELTIEFPLWVRPLSDGPLCLIETEPYLKSSPYHEEWM
jgi:hypothetical protein